MEIIIAVGASVSLGMSLIAIVKVIAAARQEHRIAALEDVRDKTLISVAEARDKALEGIGRVAIIEIEHSRTKDDLRGLYDKIDKLIENMNTRAVVTSTNELLLKQLLEKLGK